MPVCKTNMLIFWIILIQDGMHCSGQPGMRGGHQMCVDSERQLIFLLGGWDGVKDLSDFWVYDIANTSWQCISEDIKADVSGYVLFNLCML